MWLRPIAESGKVESLFERLYDRLTYEERHVLAILAVAGSSRGNLHEIVGEIRRDPHSRVRLSDHDLRDASEALLRQRLLLTEEFAGLSFDARAFRRFVLRGAEARAVARAARVDISPEYQFDQIWFLFWCIVGGAAYVVASTVAVYEVPMTASLERLAGQRQYLAVAPPSLYVIWSVARYLKDKLRRRRGQPR